MRTYIFKYTYMFWNIKKTSENILHNRMCRLFKSKFLIDKTYKTSFVFRTLVFLLSVPGRRSGSVVSMCPLWNVNSTLLSSFLNVPLSDTMLIYIINNLKIHFNYESVDSNITGQLSSLKTKESHSIIDS